MSVDQKREELEPQSIMKPSNGCHNHTNTSRQSSSRIKRSRVAPIFSAAANSQPDMNGRLSPAFSDRTDTNKSVKRVAFTDDPHLETNLQSKIIKVKSSNEGTLTVSGSPTELKKARRKRERDLRKRLLNKMGEAEVCIIPILKSENVDFCCSFVNSFSISSSCCLY